MKTTRLIMGMPVVVEIIGAERKILEKVFGYFSAIDEQFSTYKQTSETSKINRGKLKPNEYSKEMKEVFALAEETKHATHGYFDIHKPDGGIDPSGLVKGWAIKKAADLVRTEGYSNFWVEVAGDIETSGVNGKGYDWSVGIRNPFKENEIVKVVYPHGQGIATSGTYIRGEHIYDPHAQKPVSTDVVSLTVIGPNVYEADRYATAAFAMGNTGIQFIESAPHLEGYAIDAHGTATMTSGFAHYTAPLPHKV